MKIIQCALLVLFLVGCGESLPRNVDAAKITLWTEYHDNIYTAKCDAIQEASEWFIVCAKDNLKGVYWIDSIDDSHYVVYAVNGKAKVHAGSFSQINASSFYLNGSFPEAESAWLSLRDKI